MVACIAVAACFMTNPKKGYTPQEGDANGVGIRLVTEITADSETVTVKWVNSTSDEVVYGEPYDIERLENGEWISCAKIETFFILPGYSLRAGKSAEKEYGLSNFNLTQPGEYRFVANYHFDKDRPITEDESYKVWAAFTIGLENR